MDKACSVSENGAVTASFTYDVDGQIATAKTHATGKQESFLWDGLALIHRGGTSYINEPYVTGGNPILAEDKVLFNDMLGTTLGVHSEKYEPIARDAFGMTSKDADSAENFFTGKPYIGELGYAFLFRNYRPEQGKWQTSDPLGYPDGWNNLAYVNNGVTNCYDWLGAEGHIISKIEKITFSQGNGRFSVKISAYCNDDYQSPALTNISVNKHGNTSVSIGFDFTLGGVDFGASATVSFDSVSSTVIGTHVVDNHNGTKTITSDIYVTYTITGREVLLIGAIEKSETRNQLMSISCTVKE